MEWGQKQYVGSESEANMLRDDAMVRFPEVQSAYVPSGKTTPGGIMALLLGGGIGAPLGGLAAALLGAITVGLLIAFGFLIALIAVCGWVVCITVVIEIAIGLIGGGLTFGAAGGVPGWITAHAGMYGKNRSRLAAVLISIPSAIVSFGILMATPQVLAMMVDNSADEVSFGYWIHTAAEFGWVQILIWVVGFVVAMGAAYFAATSEVEGQKFCEPCDAHMEETRMHGMSFEFAQWAFQTLRAGGAAAVAEHLVQPTGVDVEPSVFICPSCNAGYFEARAHVRAEWRNVKGETEDMHREWLCFSEATPPDQTPALTGCVRHEG